MSHFPLKIWVFTGFLILLVLPLMGQYQNLRFNNYNETRGLTSNNVNCFVEDAEGFMWVGTENGLCRFDGYSFKTYTNQPDDTTSLIHNHVLCLFVASDSTLYVGTQYGVCYYQAEYDRFVQVKEGYIHGFVRGFYEDGEGRVNVVIDHGEIYTVERHKLVSRYDAKTYAFSYLKGTGNIHWFGGEDGFYKYDAGNNTKKHFRLPGFNPDQNVAVFALEEFHDELWIGTRGYGVFIFNIKTEEIRQFGSDKDFVKSFAKEREDYIFIGDTKGLRIYNRNYKLVGHQQSFSDKGVGEAVNSIDAIYTDRQGNLWLGVKFKGIMMACPNKGFRSLQTLFELNGLSPIAVASIAVRNDNEIWLGSFNNGIVRLNLHTFSAKYIPCKEGDSQGLQCGSVFELFYDSDSALWIGTYFGGLQKMLPGSEKVINYAQNFTGTNVLGGSDIRSICKDRQGNLWLAPHGSGILKWNRETGKTTQFFNDPDDLTSFIINWGFHIICDSHGYIWAATSDGLAVSRDGTHFDNYQHDPKNAHSLLSNEVFTVFEDSKNRIWVGTRLGLSRYREETNDFVHYTTENGLVNDYVCAILEDENGYIWISTKGGLSRMDAEAGKFYNYDESDDIGNKEFMENACAKTPSGYLIFGSVNGGTWFHPDSITLNKTPPKVYITGFKIFNQSVGINPGKKEALLSKHIQYTKELTIDHNQKMISFDFVALNFNHPEQNEYAYKMENFDKNWIMAQGKREATYTNLPPGDYTFRVKAANNDGIWNETGASIHIKVLPPFWQTWWFRIGVAVLLLGIVLLIYYLRMHRIRVVNRTLEVIVDKRTRELREMNSKLHALNATKDKFFSIISHDLINPMNTIRGFSELYLISHEKISDEKKLSFVKYINETVEKTLSLLTDLLKWAKSQSGTLQFNPHKINLLTMVRHSISLYQEVAQKKNIEFVIDTDDNFVTAWSDENMINTVIRNLISNSLKFTPPGGKIAIIAGPHSAAGYVKVEIRDTGVGISQEDIKEIFNFESTFSTQGTAGEEGSGLGLMLCREFVEKNGGSIWVVSEINKGSSFFFTLPMEEREE